MDSKTGKSVWIDRDEVLAESAGSEDSGTGRRSKTQLQGRRIISIKILRRRSGPLSESRLSEFSCVHRCGVRAEYKVDSKTGKSAWIDREGVLVESSGSGGSATRR